jgi:hypothetical protein
MKYEVTLSESPLKKKKLRAVIYKNGKKIKTVDFGATGYSDFTIHKDHKRMKRYEGRHKRNENWGISGITTAGFWSKWILWSKPGKGSGKSRYKEPIKYTENKFGIKINSKSLFGRGRSPKPLDMELYNKIKNRLKKTMKAWPSAYGSGLLVSEYKAKGGRYSGGKPSKTGLTRWFDEEWINVCELPKIVKCGRKSGSTKPYPYCRPKKKITNKSPVTADFLSKKQIAKLCKKKRASPKRRMKALKRSSPKRKK